MSELRVWHVKNMPCKADHHEVLNLVEAVAVINRWVEEDLKDVNVVSNAFGMEELDGDLLEWSEWYDAEGNDIMYYVNLYEEARGE